MVAFRVPNSTAPHPLILIVDDNADAREMYCLYLNYDGFRCVEASDGLDAIAKAKAEAPDLILMDGTMPGIDGWETIRRLKSDPDTERIPVVMLTANAFAEHRDRSEATGALDFLTKPVAPDVLAAEIRRILGLQ